MFNFMPSPDMMARLGIQGPPRDMGNPMGGMGGGMMQNPDFIRNMAQPDMPSQNGAMPGRRMMPMPNPMPGPQPSGPNMGNAAQKPGMMNRFTNMAMAAAPMFSNMLMDDERKKEALRYR
jgi:hypothetical protein